MNRRVIIYISFSLLCGVGLLAQNWRPPDNKWTDKNNTERYAAYLLTATYYESRAIVPPKSKSNRTVLSGSLLSTQVSHFI
jgi:hypothetical protein